MSTACKCLLFFFESRSAYSKATYERNDGNYDLVEQLFILFEINDKKPQKSQTYDQKNKVIGYRFFDFYALPLEF